MSDIDVELGPVDYVMAAFTAGKANFSGAMRAPRQLGPAESSELTPCSSEGAR